MIVVTGATGNTGRPAAEALLAKGEKIRVVSRDAQKLDSFAARGAEAFAADIEDAQEMTRVFEGARAVYMVVPQALQREDFRDYQECVTDAYAKAAASARVPYAVTLSSIGAQHASGTGLILGLHNMESKLNSISGLNVLHLRAASFMEDLLMSIGPLRSMGFLPGSAPGDMPVSMIATRDIGQYAAGRLRARDFSGSSTQELLGPRDVTMKEAAGIIGRAIDKPNLPYMQVPFLMLEPALVQMGMPKSSAALVIEMWKAGNNGLVKAEEPRSPRNTTPTTLEDFVADVFVPIYKAKKTSA